MEANTCEQGSEEWFALRGGIPTASQFSKLVTSKGEPSKSMAEYAMVLAAERWAGKPVDAWEGNQYTDRGTELEPAARAFYEFITDNEVQEIGFVTDNDGQYGCSPDGLVGEAGGVEFKCQIAKEHIKTLLYYKKHGRCPTTYVQQTQGEIMVCERDWFDLVFYHPDLPSIIIRQEPDQQVLNGLKRQIVAVIEERDRIIEVLKTA